MKVINATTPTTATDIINEKEEPICACHAPFTTSTVAPSDSRTCMPPTPEDTSTTGTTEANTSTAWCHTNQSLRRKKELLEEEVANSVKRLLQLIENDEDQETGGHQPLSVHPPASRVNATRNVLKSVLEWDPTTTSQRQDATGPAAAKVYNASEYSNFNATGSTIPQPNEFTPQPSDSKLRVCVLQEMDTKYQLVLD